MEEGTKFYIIVALFAILIILFGALVVSKPSEIKLMSQSNQENYHTISVTGNAEQKVMPNETYIYFTIETKSDTAKMAQTQNAEIWDDLKKEFENKDYLKYQTESYNVWPETQWDENAKRSITTGYIVSNRIKITLSNLEKTGTTLDTIVTNDVNNIDSISFGLTKELQESIKKELWKTAVGDAKERAKNVADAAGATLLETPKNITLNEYNYYPYRADYSFTAKAGGFATPEMANTEVTPQELTVSVSLNLVYEYQ